MNQSMSQADYHDDLINSDIDDNIKKEIIAHYSSLDDEMTKKSKRQRSKMEDSVGAFFKEMARYPLLTAEEEVDFQFLCIVCVQLSVHIVHDCKCYHLSLCDGTCLQMLKYDTQLSLL